MRIKEIAEIGSTNTWIAENTSEADAPLLVYALRQTAGRGQRGNSWESEPGKNLTASALFVPGNIHPASQFSISEAVALAVADLLDEYGVEAAVKWPNDIYVGDRKICGILIEHSIVGQHLSRTVAGIGININQREFLSDAPNPVSLWQLTGKEYDIPAVASRLASCLEKRVGEACRADGSGRESLHSAFMSRLWRGRGFHLFLDKKNGELISARIAGVASDGMLTLATHRGEMRVYAFKEVEFLLDEK